MRAHQAAINRLNVYPVPDGDTGTNMARTLDAVVAEIDGRRRRAGPDVRRDQPRLADGCPRQQRRDPLPDPAGHRGDAQGPSRRRPAPTVAEAPRGGADRRVPGGAHAGRGHHPHRRPRERRRRRARRRPPAGRSPACCGRPATRAGCRWPARPSCCRCSRTPASSTPAAPGSCCCSTPRSTSSTASRCPSPTADGDRRRPRRGHRRRAGTAALDVGEQRYEVMFLLDLADDRIGDRSSSAGARSATRSSSSAATACGTATCTPTTSAPRSRPRSTSTAGRPDPGHRPVRGGRRRARAARGGDARRRRRRAPVDELPAVTCAVVAVSSGDGIAELFRELGVQVVVAGGQTLNPSTAELLAAVERVNADQVVVLPATRTSSPSPSRSTR